MDALANFDLSLSSYKAFCKEILDELKKSNDGIKKLFKDLAAQEICSLSNSGESLSSCISAIISLTRYLSHSNELIRNLAAKMICELFKKAAEFLLMETDPQVIIKFGKILLKLVKQIECLCSKGGVCLDADSQANLKFIKEVFKMLGINEENENDEFINEGSNQEVSDVFKKPYCDAFQKTKTELFSNQPKQT